MDEGNGGVSMKATVKAPHYLSSWHNNNITLNEPNVNSMECMGTSRRTARITSTATLLHYFKFKYIKIICLYTYS